ncbi:trigger factor [Halothece sp. PCC 7418]|uniref:trigger factor n=1 Tax=Halothece sp. (strain PCC 7418) TaxID=65093 RepID=UPI0002A085CF|nr:trigger factor [Halothece sp. PCC 7418]AFZ45489.1 trigger factor [Halothece sp. PCC 7418]
MKVTQEKLPDSQVALEIEIPAEQTKKAYEKVLKDLTHSANIPGFRKGKVPRQVLVQRFGKERLKAAAIEELLQPSIDEAIEQEKIEALGNYQLRSSFEDLTQQYKPGEPFTFSASVDVPPEVQLGDYKTLKVQAEEVKADPEQVENYLQEKREQEATLVPVEDRPAQMGDTTVIDYEGRLEESGELIEGAQAEDFELELAEGKFIEGMVEGIVGMNPEETKEISVTFPEEYAREDLAGKTAKFTVTLKELKAKELPELDDEFAEDVGEHSTMDQWREALSKQYEEQAEEQTKSNIEEAIVNALIEQTEIELPETMIEQELQTIITQSMMQLAQYGIDPRQMLNEEAVKQMKQRSRPDAIARLKQNLTLQEISKQEGLNPSEEELKAKADEVRKELDEQEQEYDEERLQEYVEEDLRQEKTLAWLREQAEVELVPEGSLQQEAEAETEAAEAVVDAESEPAE